MGSTHVRGGDEWQEDDERDSVAIDIPSEFRTLDTYKEELSIRDLWSRYLSGDLVLEPDFQRHYVWDTQRASRFIESMILGLPVPPIFLAENDNAPADVIDGHQRLETTFRFMSPLLAGPSGERWPHVRIHFPSSLTLTGVEVLKELEGRDVRSLEVNDRSALWERKLTAIWIKKESDPRMKFVLFARLNLGSMALNGQELRNCLFRGPYNKLVAQLAEDPEVLRIIGRNRPDKRMRDREKVLRFFAIAHRRDRYVRSPFRELLNDEMRENQHASQQDIARFEREFTQTAEWATRIFPDLEFRLFRLGSERNPNGFWDRRMDLIFEAELVGFHQFGHRLNQIWDQVANDVERRSLLVLGLRRRLIEVMTRTAFLNTLRERTLQPNVMRSRLDHWFSGLQSAIDDLDGTINEASAVVSLRRASTACILCPQNIDRPEDAVIVAGSEKDGLAHRFCHRQRGIRALAASPGLDRMPEPRAASGR